MRRRYYNFEPLRQVCNVKVFLYILRLRDTRRSGKPSLIINVLVLRVYQGYSRKVWKVHSLIHSLVQGQ